MVWRTVYVIVTALIAMIFPFFNGFLGLIGAASFYPLTVYFPIEMHIAQTKIPKYSFTWIWLKILSWACLIVSLVAAAGSVQGLAQDVRKYKPFQTQSIWTIQLQLGEMIDVPPPRQEANKPFCQVTKPQHPIKILQIEDVCMLSAKYHDDVCMLSVKCISKVLNANLVRTDPDGLDRAKVTQKITKVHHRRLLLTE
ncbi:hypothetical protein DH2020_003943 [Rehmannia glutinosa]|uniref:Amino acid transporter transmembrane domain-containing protein n=1 Tax=Rehmannia glutinosa TaxID=99300 RepID=A0ABR0XN17_REHGL